ncbi:hypothetical protein [Streptomyces sp. NPDC057257]|uniref:hypothetical protein n=1 Tax=Streptomyces sp. NPDC057257 TaxID=3346071 RepID=UPI0036395441
MTGVYLSYQVNTVYGATLDAVGALHLAVFAAISVSRSLLRKVTADPEQTTD